MDFINFNLKWYEERLNYYRNMQGRKHVNGEIVHEAKILHKFLQDIYDEGYFSTYDLFQNKLQAKKLLELFIKSNNEKPFDIQRKAPAYGELVYKQTEKPLKDYLYSILHQSNKIKHEEIKHSSIDKTVYDEILSFTKWINNFACSNTAIIFLLRDTLLPYIAFQSRNKNETITAIPFMVGRKFLFQFGRGDEIYNHISDAVYTALHETENTPLFFQDAAAEYIKKFLKSNQQLNSSLKKSLSAIKQNNIIVVESGVHGTMPLLLKSVDERINDIKLYTTLPWFYIAWGASYFTKKYENLRLFETLLCQDLLFQFSSLKEDIFYVHEIENHVIKKESIKELHFWNNYIKE